MRGFGVELLLCIGVYSPDSGSDYTVARRLASRSRRNEPDRLSFIQVDSPVTDIYVFGIVSPMLLVVLSLSVCPFVGRRCCHPLPQTLLRFAPKHQHYYHRLQSSDAPTVATGQLRGAKSP